jgi:choline dehydrogenase-like flavoprotein
MNFPTLCSRYFDSAQEQAKGKFILVNPPSSPAVNILGQMQGGAVRSAIDSYVLGPSQIQLHGMLEIFSEFNNRVTNFDRISHMGMVETVVDFSQADTFDQRMAEIGAHVLQIFDRMGASMTGKPSISWRADHAACTVRMANDAAQGVTDANLRVHGVDNLYICSNGTFPNTGAVNPTLTLTALALRLGDHLNNSATQFTGSFHDSERIQTATVPAPANGN